jgi:hypothetical protein
MERQMTWDAAKGVSKRTPFQGPFAFYPVDTPYRAKVAARMSAYGAGLLGLTNMLSGLAAYSGHRAVTSLLAQGRFEVAVVCTAIGLLGFLFGATIGKRPSVWAAVVLLVWAAIEAVPWITFHLYGHVAMRGFAIFALSMGVAGLRGALALRKLAEAPHPPA